MEQPAEHPGQALQRLLRVQQWNAEKQVVMQPPAPAQPAALFALGFQAFQGFGTGAQQLVLFKELTEVEDLFDRRLERCDFGNLFADLPW
ncbi:hypothetical protein D3C76_1683160 [compost metagenome]